MLEKRHHTKLFSMVVTNEYTSARRRTRNVHHHSNLRGQNDQETRRNISRLAVTSRDWRDHIRHSPAAQGTDLADYRQWLVTYQEQLAAAADIAAAAAAQPINLAQGDTADDAIEL
jgi:hypothetical protein